MLIHTLNKKECGELLKRLGFGRLGCASKNQPYVVPIYFAYEPDRLFGFSSVGQKIEWMRDNPLVCVEADEVIDYDNWMSVLVFGRYEELLPQSPICCSPAACLFTTRKKSSVGETGTLVCSNARRALWPPSGVLLHSRWRDDGKASLARPRTVGPRIPQRVARHQSGNIRAETAKS